MCISYDLLDILGGKTNIRLVTSVGILQAGGALALEKLLAGEAEDAKPEFLKQRPKVETRSCCHAVMTAPRPACLEN